MPPGPPADNPNRQARHTLRKALETQSTQVNLADLARRKKQARVLTLKTLERLMIETLENILVEGGADPLLDRSALQDRARAEFQKLLEVHQKTVTERDEAEKAREELERQLGRLHDELGEQQQRLHQELERRAPQVRFDEKSLAAMEGRLRGVMQELLRDARADGENHVDLDGVERRLEETLEQVLEQERTKARAVGEELRDVEIDRLQRRISKLNEALDSTESALHQIAGQKEFDPGVASIYREVQGLSPDAVNQAKKQEMIQIVFVNNLRLRGREVRPEDVEGLPEDMLLPSDVGATYHGFSAPKEPTTDDTAF